LNTYKLYISFLEYLFKPLVIMLENRNIVFHPNIFCFIKIFLSLLKISLVLMG